MRVKIVTLANLRPDFIELQYRTIKKFIKDRDVQYVIFNNASHNIDRFNRIENICRNLGINSIKVSGYDSDNVSLTVAKSLNEIWQKHLKYEKELLVLIDSDMFFVRSLSINKLMKHYDVAFVPNYRGNDFRAFYPWTGLMFFNMNSLPNPGELNWDTGKIHGHKVDVGGKSHNYLEKFKNRIKILYLEMWNLEDIEVNPNKTKTLKCSLNGNVRFVIKLTKENKLIDVVTNDFFLSDKKSLPYQFERKNYYNFIADTFIKFESYLKNMKLKFPHPFWVDLINIHRDPFENSFVFHYKSGSNWLPFYTPGYNRKKTEQLHRLVNSIS